MILLSKLSKISCSHPRRIQLASTWQGTGSALLSLETAHPPVWKSCQIPIAAKECSLPCMGTSSALCKAIGCTAAFGAFSPSAGLWDPKSNEERLAKRRGGKWSRLVVMKAWSGFEE